MVIITFIIFLFNIFLIYILYYIEDYSNERLLSFESLIGLIFVSIFPIINIFLFTVILSYLIRYGIIDRCIKLNKNIIIYKFLKLIIKI